MPTISKLEQEVKAAAAQTQTQSSGQKTPTPEKRGPGRPKTPLLPTFSSQSPAPRMPPLAGAPFRFQSSPPQPPHVHVPAIQAIPTVRHTAARRILDELTLRSLQMSGAHNPFVASARLNATLVRALDKDNGNGNGTAPAWLVTANQQAERELAEWFALRRLPANADCEDPGVPTEEDGEHAATFPFIRPQNDEEKLVEWLKCRQSVVYFIDNYCKLAHKELGIIPFRLWPWQAWLLHQWQAHDQNITLKARQLGVSELAAGFSGHLIRFHDTKLALLISRGEDEAMELLGRYRVMEANLPRWLLPGLGDAPNPECVDAIAQSKSNTRMLEYVHFDEEGAPRYSRIESLPATQGTGRSRTASLVVLDEWAHMQWGAAIWAGVEATADNGGKVLGISTANGVGDIFEVIYSTAAAERDNARQSTQAQQTTARQKSPAPASAPVDSGGGDPDAPTRKPGRPKKKRRDLAGFFPVFLSWRRHPDRDDEWYEEKKAQRIRENQLPMLHQEFPAEALEAFIQSGRPVFDADYLNEHQRRIREEQAARMAEALPPWRALDGLTIYEESEPGYDYIIGADTAEGKEGGDFDAAVVICRQTGREVATLHGLWPFEVYAAKLDEVGYRYNRALLAVERNNHGHSVILALNSGLAHEQWDNGKRAAYPNLYHYKAEDVPGQRQVRRPGWETNIRTKPMAVNSLGRALREQVYFPRDEAFLTEAKFFSWDETGRACGAPPNKHDDRVACRWIAVHLLLQPDEGALAMAYLREWNDRTWEKVARLMPDHARDPRLRPLVAPSATTIAADDTESLESVPA